MPPVGFEPATPASEGPQTRAFDRAAIMICVSVEMWRLLGPLSIPWVIGRGICGSDGMTLREDEQEPVPVPLSSQIPHELLCERTLARWRFNARTIARPPIYVEYCLYVLMSEYEMQRNTSQNVLLAVDG